MRAVFTLITFIFTICVICTITSFKEVPLRVIEEVEAEDPVIASPEITENAKIVNNAKMGTYGAVSGPENGAETMVSYIRN